MRFCVIWHIISTWHSHSGLSDSVQQPATTQPTAQRSPRVLSRVLHRGGVLQLDAGHGLALVCGASTPLPMRHDSVFRHRLALTTSPEPPNQSNAAHLFWCAERCASVAIGGLILRAILDDVSCRQTQDLYLAQSFGTE